MVRDSLKKYYYVFGLVAGTFVVVLILSLFVIKPLVSTVLSMNEENNNLNTTLISLKAKQEALNKLKGQETQLENDSQTVSNALPTQADIGRLFIQLDSIAKASGGNLKSVTTSSSADNTANGVTAITYSIPLDMPNYFAFKQFITNAQGALRLLSIDGVGVNASSTGALTLNISARSYTRASQ